MEVTIGIHPKPARLAADQALSLKPPTDPSLPFMLVRQPDGTWVGIVLEPGIEWELRRKGQPATPAARLWLPGMPR
jgi:hypothetical protein